MLYWTKVFTKNNYLGGNNYEYYQHYRKTYSKP